MGSPFSLLSRKEKAFEGQIPPYMQRSKPVDAVIGTKHRAFESNLDALLVRREFLPLGLGVIVGSGLGLRIGVEGYQGGTPMPSCLMAPCRVLIGLGLGCGVWDVGCGGGV